MENIELRWYVHTEVDDDGFPHNRKSLQYRKYYDAGAYAGFYATPPAVNLQWSDWTDVPTVIA